MFTFTEIVLFFMILINIIKPPGFREYLNILNPLFIITGLLGILIVDIPNKVSYIEKNNKLYISTISVVKKLPTYIKRIILFTVHLILILLPIFTYYRYGINIKKIITTRSISLIGFIYLIIIILYNIHIYPKQIQDIYLIKSKISITHES